MIDFFFTIYYKPIALQRVRSSSIISLGALSGSARSCSHVKTYFYEDTEVERGRRGWGGGREGTVHGQRMSKGRWETWGGK